MTKSQSVGHIASLAAYCTLPLLIGVPLWYSSWMHYGKDQTKRNEGTWHDQDPFVVSHTFSNSFTNILQPNNSRMAKIHWRASGTSYIKLKKNNSSFTDISSQIKKIFQPRRCGINTMKNQIHRYQKLKQNSWSFSDILITYQKLSSNQEVLENNTVLIRSRQAISKHQFPALIQPQH